MRHWKCGHIDREDERFAGWEWAGGRVWAAKLTGAPHNRGWGAVPRGNGDIRGHGGEEQGNDGSEHHHEERAREELVNAKVAS